MTVSNVSSSNNPYDPTSQAGFKQHLQDFKALDNALQSGDLSAAQSAFAAFQRDVQKSSPAAQGSQPFGKNDQEAKDVETLQSALKSGDLSGAQKAIAALKHDMKAGRARHHHHAQAPSPSPTDSTTQQTTAANATLNATSVTGLLNVQA
jgi:hypothetical protein